jgi:hypothetical protein
MKESTKKEIIYFLKSIVCSFKMNHAVAIRVEFELETGLKKYTSCERCNMPLSVMIDPDDPDYMIVSEDYGE